MKDNDYQPSQAASQQAEQNTCQKDFSTYLLQIGRMYFTGMILAGFASQFAMENSRVCDDCTVAVALVCDERIKIVIIIISTHLLRLI